MSRRMVPHLSRGQSKSSEVMPALIKLGFTEYEARAYVALTREHPATAYVVAKNANLPRANVYAALRALEIKGAIQPISEAPVQYVPIAPQTFFGSLQREMAGLCKSAALALDKQASASDDVYVQVVRGADEILSRTMALIRKARKHVWIKAAEDALEPLLESFTEAAKRGVDVRLIAHGEHLDRFATHAGISMFPHEGDGVVRSEPQRLLFAMVVDGAGVLIASRKEPATASYARNPAIVYTVQTLLLHEIYLAEIYRKFGPQLTKQYGKGLLKLRKKYRPEHRESIILAGV